MLIVQRSFRTTWGNVSGLIDDELISTSRNRTDSDAGFGVGWSMRFMRLSLEFVP